MPTNNFKLGASTLSPEPTFYSNPYLKQEENMFSLDLETHLWERMYFQVWIKRSVLPDIFRILAFSTRTS